MLRPVNDSILFVFVDSYENNAFVNKTDSGIVYKTLVDSAGSPRWVKVIAVGNKVEYVKPGMEVLVDALRWTEGFRFEDTMMWRTAEKEVIGIKEI
jgi:hypothetical protein